MRLRFIVVLSSLVLAVVALAGPSWAAAPGIRSGVVVTVTDFDAAGRPLGPSYGVASARRGGRSLQASGCREVDITKDGRSFLFHSLVYRWHHSKRWCWSNGRVTGVWSSAYATNMDANWYYRGISASAGYFYGANQSGHYSFREAEMQNCILKYGCIGTEYPWVKIWARGDGSYAWQTGS